MVSSHLERQTVVAGLSFGEGPRWHDGSLYLSDMHHHRVLKVDVSQNPATVEIVAQHDSAVSGLGWLPDGDLIVVAMNGEVLRAGPSGLARHADLSELAPHGVNDMIVHAGGWAYVGQFGYDREGGGRPVPAALLRVDVDGTVTPAASDMLVANGMILTADQRTLLVAESAGRRITAFAVDANGRLTNRRVWAALPDNHYPDGMCLDAEGAAWVACPTAGRFIRVLEGGTVTDEIPVEPDRHAIACVLGGTERLCLYLLSAATLGNAEQSQALLSGRLESVSVAISGAGRP
jgi:sugar lactone lactonase YvrE